MPICIATLVDQVIWENGKREIWIVVFCALKDIFHVLWKFCIYNLVKDTEEGQVIETIRKNSESIESICLAHIGTLSRLCVISKLLALGYVFEHKLSLSAGKSSA